MEALAAADPAIVLVAPCGYGLEAAAAEAARLLDDPAWGWLAGRAVWALDANALVSRPGPRVVDGIEAMARIFNPACFTPLDPAHARRITPSTSSTP
jgi:iron complex transport system substrate-binding protein